jgi:3-hydroxyacyl-CoA dehydrogenase
MGSGIAGLCAEAGCRVLLLDTSAEVVAKAHARMTEGKAPLIEDPVTAQRVSVGTVADDMDKLADCDWICEAIVEDLASKHQLMERVESVRRDGSIVTSNTSGIPLRDIGAGMPARLRRDLAVTHFFNPVKVMRLLELVRGEETDERVIETLAEFCANRLGKGVVYAKDTVNFIGNRIGCFWMLSGLHHGQEALAEGLDIETLDALMSSPVGLPRTGLYGLIDLVGLDVMNLVGKNLRENLPPGDTGLSYIDLPSAEQAMLERKQLGRKTGGGFYRLTKSDDGSKHKEVFEPLQGSWRPAKEVVLDPVHGRFKSLLASGDAAGRFAWRTMGGTLCYAADLVPAIADDIVNVDRALRWGFNWRQGPFELLDALDPKEVAARVQAENKPVPRMLQRLVDAGADTFYRTDGGEYLGIDGHYHPVPEE